MLLGRLSKRDGISRKCVLLEETGELARVVLRNLVESPAPNRDIVAHLPCSLASSRMSLISRDSVRAEFRRYQQWCQRKGKRAWELTVYLVFQSKLRRLQCRRDIRVRCHRGKLEEDRPSFHS